MNIAEKIQKHVKGLPEQLQAEVLDFVEFMETKAGRSKEADAEWSELSLSSAMRGMEDETTSYSLEDLQETF